MQPSLFSYVDDSDIDENDIPKAINLDAIARRIAISNDGGLDASIVDRIPATAFVNESFHKQYRNQRPVIITGLAHWCHAIDWMSPDTYTGSHDSIVPAEVLTLVAIDGRNFLKHEKCYQVDKSISEALEIIHSSSDRDCHPHPNQLLPADEIAEAATVSPQHRIYCRYYLDALPSLASKISLDLLHTVVFDNGKAFRSPGSESTVGRFKLSNIGIWLSCQGCETPLHFDLCHGFLIQAYGHKRFLLAPPDDSNSVYWDRSPASKNACSSKVDLTQWLQGSNTERQRYPLIAEVAWFQASLSPGDTLYTPPGWWHHVISESPSASVLVPFDPNPDVDRVLPSNVMNV